ncbi:MAG: AAA family ATPase, partial [Candidatus Lokiarchaeota archaeon]|nr:AAA family ATPase [Candidatus Lokiarchaeota archaeon]
IDNFKIKNDSLNKKYNLWGFRGLAGAMFFNQLYNGENNKDRLEKEIKRYLLEPDDIEGARLKIDNFSKYVKEVGEKIDSHNKSPKPRSSIYFLSYFWHIQSPEKYPIFFPKSRKVLKKLGLFDELGRDDYGNLYLEFLNIIQEIFNLIKKKIGTTLPYDTINNILEWYFDEIKRKDVWICPKESCEYVEIEITRNDKNIIDSGSYRKIIVHFLQHLKNDNRYFSSPDIYEIFLDNSSEDILSEEEIQTYPSRHKIWKNQIRSVLGIMTKEGYLETDELEEIDKIYNKEITEKKKLRTRKRTEKFFEEFELFDDWELYSILPVPIKIEPDYSNFINSKIDIENIKIALLKKKQIILMGPPGTSKSYLAEQIALDLIDDSSNYEIIQFHPSYSYEEFVEGIEIESTRDNPFKFTSKKKIFRKVCEFSKDLEEGSYYVLIIDEINRGNVEKIFGELIFGLEKRDKAIKTLYINNKLEIPNNLLIIGTMNTVDLSIANIDAALRRRFHIITIMPDKKVLENWLSSNYKDNFKDFQVALIQLMEDLNEKITSDTAYLGPYRQLGHTYFFIEPEENIENLKKKVDLEWNYTVKPLLLEYFNFSEEKLGEYEILYNNFKNKF